MSRRILAVFVVAVVLGFGACHGTLAMPSPDGSKRAIGRYLKHYAKKYPESELGRHPLEKVEIYELTLDKKGHAEVAAFFSLRDQGLYQAAFTLKHEPLRWKVVSWEILQHP